MTEGYPTERYPEEMGSRIMGVIRDKAVADRAVRALIHSGFAPQDVTVVVSGANEFDFKGHEPGVQIIRYPEVSETGAFAREVQSGGPQMLMDWGVPESEMSTWEARLQDGDVILVVTCGSNCGLARSLFMDAGATDIMVPQFTAPQREMTPPSEPMRPSEPMPPDTGYMPPPEDRGYVPPPDVNARPPEGPSGVRMTDNPYDDRWDFESDPRTKPTIERERKTYGPPPPDVPPDDAGTRS